MATVTKHTIQDGERNLIVKLHITGGTELSDEVLIDASSYSPAFTDAAIMRVQGVMPALEAAGGAGPQLTLEWNADTNVPIMTIAQSNFDLDFSCFGGIPNNAGTGVNGDIIGQSQGATASTGYFLILHIRKK